MIGEGAKQQQATVHSSHTDMFDRIAYVGQLFRIAEACADEKTPLLNTNPRVYEMSWQKINAKAFSDVPVSQSHRLLLAVGSEATGFYQVPIIRLAGGKGESGVDVMVSGTIDGAGVSEKFAEPKRLSAMANELYGTGIEGVSTISKVYAVALMPKVQELGQDVLIAGVGPASSVYHLAVNGFAMERKIVSGGSVFGAFGTPNNELVPIMYPQEGGEERYMRLGDILGKRQLAKAESAGVFPGMTFVAGGFQHKFVMPAMFSRSLRAGSDLLRSALHDEAPATMKGDVGRVGLEVGSKSDVSYGQAQGHISSIDGILALHFLGVEKGAKIAKIKAEIEKLAV